MPLKLGGNGQGVTKLKDALRVGLCGIGRAGFGMVLRDFQKLPHVRVVAGFDLLEERTRQLAEMCSSRVYGSYAQMLKDDELDLVIVATRSHEHVAMALQAMKAGRDVLVEKPMALDLAGADKLIATAEKSGRKLYVRQNRRFDVPFLQAMEIVNSGKIGKLFAVQLRQGGFQRRADWQTLKKFGGGQLLNWGPHLVDWALQFIGGRAADVWADLKLIAAAGNAEDHVKLLIRGESGIIADIEISGATAITQPPWILMGTTGTLTIDAKNQCRLKYFDPKGLPKLKASGATPAGRAGSHFSGGEEIRWVEEQFPAAPATVTNFWVELYKSIRKGTAFPITLAQARETMRVISLAKKGTRF
ncbi:MAG: Gfo/Idh/MocA family oxidoreductase [Tepidisphaeraceae bacterium]